MTETTTTATCPECGGEDREYGHQLACARGLSPDHRAVELAFFGEPCNGDLPEFDQGFAAIATPGGKREVPALMHPWCPGLAVTMAEFGLFCVTHTASGLAMCAPRALAADACQIMAECTAIGRVIGLAWESATADEILAAFKEHADTPVPFGGTVVIVGEAKTSATIEVWRMFLHGEDDYEWPITDDGDEVLRTLTPAQDQAP